MNLKKFYESMDVDYSRVLNRLRREQLIEKYLHLFVKDENFEVLNKSVESEDYESAFRAAHSIKGVALNLDLKPVAETASVLVEYFRGQPQAEYDRTRIKELCQVLNDEFEKIKGKIE